jgi:hypothetical protein
MLNNFCLAMVIAVMCGACASRKAADPSDALRTGKLEIVFKATVNNKPLFLDSIYHFPGGEQFTLRSLKFFVSNVAVSLATGIERQPLIDPMANGSYLINFENENPAIRFDFPAGAYTDLRFWIGLPRALNHSDPTSAPPPLDLGKGDMYWEWNSGYIFLLAEGRCEAVKGSLFHFAIGEDQRILPLSFGNLFETSPLLRINENDVTRVIINFDFNNLFINWDGSSYNILAKDAAIVHGGHNADILRENAVRAFKIEQVSAK